MLTHGTIYTTYSCIQASLSLLFIEIYHFSVVQAGSIYLPCGIRCVLASYFTGLPPFSAIEKPYLLLLGKVLNRDSNLTTKAHNIVIDELTGDDLSKFPIEKARLRSVWFFVILCAICIAGYGWSVNKKMVRFPLFYLFLTLDSVSKD
jgi:hypothetical protein